jgi:RNA polymerase sigma-70 factor (ECF subfamily)
MAGGAYLKAVRKVLAAAATISSVEDPEAPARDAARDWRAVDWPAALERHGRWLRRVILSRLGERQAVEEVMQEVSLAAVASPAPPRDDAASVGAWLYRVAVRQTLLYRRRSGRRRKLLDAFVRRGAAADANSAPPDPLGWLLSAERAVLVREAIARLPRRDADVLVLKYTEQWSYRELAAHLGTTESAVEARLHRARARLREELSRLRLNEESS